MKVKAQRRLAALRKLAEKNEEAAAQADTIDAADSEAVEAVSYRSDIRTDNNNQKTTRTTTTTTTTTLNSRQPRQWIPNTSA